MASCLAGNGFTPETAGVSATADGGITATIPPNLQARWDVILERCQHQTGYDQPPPALTPDMLAYLYSRYLLTYECLLKNDYSPQPKVDLKSFIASGGKWNPYDGIEPEPGADPGILTTECPIEM